MLPLEERRERVFLILAGIFLRDDYAEHYRHHALRGTGPMSPLQAYCPTPLPSSSRISSPSLYAGPAPTPCGRLGAELFILGTFGSARPFLPSGRKPCPPGKLRLAEGVFYPTARPWKAPSSSTSCLPYLGAVCPCLPTLRAVLRAAFPLGSA